jgi:exosortase/archaeosortase family protein
MPAYRKRFLRGKAARQESRTGRLASPLSGTSHPLLVALIATPLFALYFYPYAENGVMATAIQAYLSLYARLVGLVISTIDPQIVVLGNTIHGSLFSMSIAKTCDAIEVNILLVAALAAFPMPLRRRIVAVLAACSAIILLNLFRLCTLYWLGVNLPTWFDRVHQVLAPLFMVAGATGIFLIATTSRICRGTSKDQALTAAPR